MLLPCQLAILRWSHQDLPRTDTSIVHDLLEAVSVWRQGGDIWAAYVEEVRPKSADEPLVEDLEDSPGDYG